MGDNKHAITPGSKRRPRRWPFVLLGLASLLWVAALAAVVGFWAYERSLEDRIYPGVWVAHADLGGLTREQAIATLDASGIAVPAEQVNIQYQGQTWSLWPQDLEIHLDAEVSAALAYEVGRGGTLGADLREQVLVYLRPRVLTPVFSLVDQGKIAHAVALIAREVNRAPREAKLTVEGLEVRSTPGERGIEVDQAATIEAVRRQFRAGGGGEVELIVRQAEPALADVSEGQQLIEQALSSPITLEHRSSSGEALTYTLDRETLANWLQYSMDVQPEGEARFSVGLSESDVRAWAEELAEELYISPEDATFDFDADQGELLVIAPSRWGRELDVDETVQRILDTVLDQDRAIELPVVDIKPALPMEEASSMGIRELVAEATTRFAGSSSSRVHNIDLAASQFRDIIIEPGGIFSFNEHLGEVDEESGYQESLIIWGNSTQAGWGGGVCQVSTTAFRTALLGGFPIVERYPHGYVVSWYGEPGMDATVYAPYVDFRFRNDREHYLYIDTSTDTVAGTVTFSFYGTADGREVGIDISEPENVSDPPPPVYTEDASLPEGTIKQVDWAVRGMDVTVTREVTLESTLLFEDTFVSKYLPWSAKYLYGPGTTLPSAASTPAAAATPTPTPIPSDTPEPTPATTE